MGVDLSISVGAGLVFPEKDPGFQAWLEVNDETGDGAHEALYQLDLPDGINFGNGGSYYDDTPHTFWFAPRRLLTTMDRRDAPAGVHPLNIRAITLAERTALDQIAHRLGVSEPVITPFLSVLWH
jgi:hypothetical protein